MEEFEKKANDIKIATVSWFDYDEWKKSEERRREHENCYPCDSPCSC